MKKTNDISEQKSIVSEPAATYGLGNSTSPFDLINKSRSGVSMEFVNKVTSKLQLSFQELANILHVSLRTLQRYTPSKNLDTDSSAKILQLETLSAHGLSVFESEGDFNEWLRTPLAVLGNEKPIDLLDTPYGFALVQQQLGRIEHGIFA